MKELIDTVKNYDKVKEDLNKPYEILEAERLEAQAKKLRMSAANKEGLDVLNFLKNALDIMNEENGFHKYTSNYEIGRGRIISAAWAVADHYDIDLEEYFATIFIE
jgi:hypothetical protein